MDSKVGRPKGRLRLRLTEHGIVAIERETDIGVTEGNETNKRSSGTGG